MSTDNQEIEKELAHHKSLLRIWQGNRRKLEEQASLQGYPSIDVSNALEDAKNHIKTIEEKIEYLETLLRGSQNTGSAGSNAIINKLQNPLHGSHAGDFVDEFLNRICLPVAEELGLFLKDKIKAWRANNTIKISEKAEAMLFSQPDRYERHAHPRIVSKILEEGSWTDVDEVQGMWAGLLASSCTLDGKDESNLMFIDLLSRITSSQARVLNYACRSSKKTMTEHGLLMSMENEIENINEIIQISHVNELHVLDRELDHLRSLGLIEDGITWDGLKARVSVTSTALALQMYTRCQGYIGNPSKFFDFEDIAPPLDMENTKE
jgi:abortive infection alpha-like protein